MTSNFTNNGKAFEKALERTIIQYQSRGIMRLKKVDPPTKSFGGGRIIHLENPFLDYVGCWTGRGGRAIFIEAKSTKKPTLAMGSSGISDKQLDALRHWSNAGAAAFLLWQYNQLCLFVSAQSVALRFTERKHLKLEDGIPVPQGIGNVIHDFLPAMLKTWPASRDEIIEKHHAARIDSIPARKAA